MENETNDVDINNEEALELDGAEEEAVVEKPKKKDFTDEEQLAIHQREIKKLSKKLGKETELPKATEVKGKSEDLDYGQKAFLRSYDIKGADELMLVKQFQDRGFDLDSIVTDDVFTAKLGNLREARATALATPKGTKRSSSSSGDTDFDRALSKFRDSGDLPDNFEMKAKVLNHAAQNDSSVNPFGK